MTSDEDFLYISSSSSSSMMATASFLAFASIFNVCHEIVRNNRTKGAHFTRDSLRSAFFPCHCLKLGGDGLALRKDRSREAVKSFARSLTWRELREKEMPSMILSTNPYDFSSSSPDVAPMPDAVSVQGVEAGVSRISIVMNNWSKLMQMGDVVMDVQGMMREREEHRADEIRIRDSESAEDEDGDNRNRDFSVSSFSSRLCNVIVDPEDPVDSWLGFKFLKNLQTSMMQ